MTKEAVLSNLLRDIKAIDFYGINAPEAITVTVNEYLRTVTFNRIFKTEFYGDELETTVYYQSEEKNVLNEYPIVELVVRKKGKKRISYEFIMGWDKTHLW